MWLKVRFLLSGKTHSMDWLSIMAAKFPVWGSKKKGKSPFVESLQMPTSYLFFNHDLIYSFFAKIASECYHPFYMKTLKHRDKVFVQDHRAKKAEVPRSATIKSQNFTPHSVALANTAGTMHDLFSKVELSKFKHTVYWRLEGFHRAIKSKKNIKMNFVILIRFAQGAITLF